MAFDPLIDSFDFSKYGQEEYYSLWLTQIEKGVSDRVIYGFKLDPDSEEGKMANPYATYLNRSLMLIQKLDENFSRDIWYFTAWRNHWKDMMSVDMSRYLCALIRMYKTGNLEYIKYYVTEERYKMYQDELDTLKRFNLRKEIDFQFVDDQPGAPKTIKESDGKNTIFSPGHYGSYKETYYGHDGSIVYEDSVDLASIRLYMYRTKFKEMLQETQTDICFNCAGEMEHKFEIYRCPHCNTEYDSESMTWIVTDFYVEEERAIPQDVAKLKKKSRINTFGKNIKKAVVNILGNAVLPILFLASIFLAFANWEELLGGQAETMPDIFRVPWKFIPLGLFLLPLVVLLILALLGFLFMLVRAPKVFNIFKRERQKNYLYLKLQLQLKMKL